MDKYPINVQTCHSSLLDGTLRYSFIIHSVASLTMTGCIIKQCCVIKTPHDCCHNHAKVVTRGLKKKKKRKKLIEFRQRWSGEKRNESGGVLLAHMIYDGCRNNRAKN